MTGRLNPLQTTGLVIFTVTCMIPGLTISGFWPEWNVLSLGAWMAIAAAGGAAGGALFMPELGRWYIGAVGGLVAGPGSLYATVWWAAGRDSLWNAELVLVGAVGSVPGILLGAILYRWLARRPS
jgi:hypothetical protein